MGSEAGSAGRAGGWLSLHRGAAAPQPGACVVGRPRPVPCFGYRLGLLSNTCDALENLVSHV